MESLKCRSIVLYKNYFAGFFAKQRQSVKDKILWTFKLIEELNQIPETYLKHLQGTNGLYEIRVQSGNNIYRLFCFFDDRNLVILINAFQKKTQKTPQQEIDRAIKIKKDYYEEKKQSKKT